MRARLGPIVIALVALPLLEGCDKSPRDRLQGKWRGVSVDRLQSSQQQLKADGWVKGTTLEFSGNKVTVAIPAESPRSGTFKIAKVEGDKMTLAFKRAEGGEDSADFKFSPDGKLVWKLGGADVVLAKAVD
jgi:hypothetical protein